MRTRTKILPILFAVAVASAVVIVSVANDGLPPSNVEQGLPPTKVPGIRGPITFPEIVLDENLILPEMPDKVMVYKAKLPEVTAEKVIALAETLGLSDSISEYDESFVVRDGSIDLEVLKASGRISYMDLAGAYDDIHNPPNLPPEGDAIASAEKFLHDKGLMPGDAEFSEVVRDYAELVTKDPNTGEVSIEKVDLDMQVRFSREINGIPVTGAGSKLYVYIGDSGEIVKVFRCWREYEPFKPAVILTPSQALQKLKESGIHTLTERVTLKEMYLAYYTLGATEVQDYLQPVYVFEIDTGEAHIPGYILKQTIPAILQAQ
jgi:hypothetical protein